ncbi:MAG TPA: outer membrane lipid asymmetry maintenance protein MlaD [Candidatus Limnocylindrales bacterium]|nr:outer membrane lipid asymmetry maintenance protein MlaD [Candidatus Limnocylindrales bacterium]
MNESATRDFLVGLFVLAGLAALAFLSFSIGGLRYTGKGGLPVYATFDQIAGLKPKAPVEIAGVKVGAVTGISLDETYRARVDMDLDADLKLPVDSSAAIVTAGLLGDRYIQLSPGAEDRHLAPGEQIPYTENALVMERLIGKFLVNVGDSGSEKPAGGGGTGAPTAPAE